MYFIRLDFELNGAYPSAYPYLNDEFSLWLGCRNYYCNNPDVPKNDGTSNTFVAFMEDESSDCQKVTDHFLSYARRIFDDNGLNGSLKLTVYERCVTLSETF